MSPWHTNSASSPQSDSVETAQDTTKLLTVSISIRTSLSLRGMSVSLETWNSSDQNSFTPTTYASGSPWQRRSTIAVSFVASSCRSYHKQQRACHQPSILHDAEEVIEIVPGGPSTETRHCWMAVLAQGHVRPAPWRRCYSHLQFLIAHGHRPTPRAPCADESAAEKRAERPHNHTRRPSGRIFSSPPVHSAFSADRMVSRQNWYSDK